MGTHPIFESDFDCLTEMSRNRPWLPFTQIFYKSLDIVFSELTGQACTPKVPFNATRFCVHLILMILSIPILSLGVIIATFCDVFLNFKNHSSLKTSAPPAQMKNELTILSNNTCLMPEALARVNNLPFAVKRAEGIGKKLTNREGFSTSEQIELELPKNVDVICLQEVFNEHAWKILNKYLSKEFCHILYDAQKFWISPLHFTIENSGLYLASKYPIIQSRFYPYKDMYLEDGLSCKGLLLAEIDVGGESLIVGNTHLQAPTGNRIKASKARISNWHQISDFLSDFKNTASQKIKLEVICGDFNTDPLTDYDAPCFDSKVYRDFEDPFKSFQIASCLEEIACQHEDLCTSQGLKKALLSKNPDFLWSSDRTTKEGNWESIKNGQGRLDYILHKSSADFSTENHFHSTLASLTDHIPISTKFTFK